MIDKSHACNNGGNDDDDRNNKTTVSARHMQISLRAPLQVAATWRIFNSIIPIPLPIYPESFITISATVSHTAAMIQHMRLLTVGDSVVLFVFSFLSFFLFNFVRCPCNVFDVIVSP